MLTSGHDVYDNRIYYKEILSLKKHYDEIYLVAPGKESFVTKQGVTVKCFKGRTSWHDRMRPMKEMYQIALEIHADVYHAHEPDSFQVALKLKKKTGAKAVYDSHEYHPEAFAEHFSYGKSIVKNLIYRYEKNMAEHADYIITVNNILVNKFKKYNKNVALLPNYPVLSEANIEKEYFKKPVFVYTGGLRDDRGTMKILEAVKNVKNDCRFIFIGGFENDSYKEKVENYIKNELNGRDITFTGKIPHLEVFNYLKCADAGFVLLMPVNLRYVNSEPIKLFEYMMSKTAVIASAFPMMKNIVEGSKCGYTVDPENAISIAKTIDYIAENREEAKAMGLNGYADVVNKYNWSYPEDKLLSLYRSFEQDGK